MNLPEYEWVRFKKSPLKMVIGQIRFTINPRFKLEGFTADFQEAIYSEYPKVSREQTVSYQLSPAGIATSPGDLVWRFSTRDNQWSVIIGEASISLETYQYLSMADFLDRFKHILQVAVEALDIKDRLRLGLRYLNEIRYPKAENLADWRSLLNPEFVGFDAAELLNGQVKHTLHEIQIERSDGTLAVRHGLLEGTVVVVPSQEVPKEKRFYLIDLDYYKVYDISWLSPNC